MNELICALARAASSAADSFSNLKLVLPPSDVCAMLFLSFAAAADTRSWNLDSSDGDISDDERYCDDDNDLREDVKRVYWS